jgi:hypothetical protein
MGGGGGDPTHLLRQARRTLLADPGRTGVVIAVDDAHLLDPLSALLVHQIVLHGAATVMVTVRSGEPAPDAITALWKDGLLERLEVQALNRVEITVIESPGLDGACARTSAGRIRRRPDFPAHLTPESTPTGPARATTDRTPSISSRSCIQVSVRRTVRRVGVSRLPDHASPPASSRPGHSDDAEHRSPAIGRVDPVDPSGSGRFTAAPCPELMACHPRRFNGCRYGVALIARLRAGGCQKCIKMRRGLIVFVSRHLPVRDLSVFTCYGRSAAGAEVCGECGTWRCRSGGTAAWMRPTTMRHRRV